MEKELKESLARYADIEEKIIENKKARLALKEEAIKLREAYWAEEKVRNALAEKVAAEQTQGDK